MANVIETARLQAVYSGASHHAVTEHTYLDSTHETGERFTRIVRSKRKEQFPDAGRGS